MIIGLLLAGPILSGCVSSPYLAGEKNYRMPASPVAETSTAAAGAASKANTQNPQGTTANRQANAQALQEIMEELRQLGTLDPAAQNKLMEDLKQTDPALWPLVMQQFRAAIAYRHRAAQRETMAANGSAPISGNPLSGENPTTDTVTQFSASGNAPAAPNPPSAASKPLPKDYYPAAAELPAASQAVIPAVDQRPAKETANQVVNASYIAPVSDVPDNRHEELSAAIKAMEAAAPSNPKNADELAQQARLRMLYVLAGAETTP